MSRDGQGTKWRRNIAENYNRLSRVRKRYRQHLSSSRVCRGPCGADAKVSQLRRTRWAPNERKALRSTQLPCCRTICLELSTTTPPKRWH